MRPWIWLLFLLAPACQTDPVSGKAYYSPLGNDYASQDKFIREQYLTELMLTNDGGLLKEPGIQAACNQVFQRVVNAVPPDHRRGFRYHFYLSPSTQVNAYTYGGGRIHCHLGLLARCRDAAEFAGVMAHEIGHNSHDHISQSLGRATLASPFARLGGLLGSPGRRLTEGLVSVTLVQFTRSQERESDDLAVDYTARAGIDPDGVARFFAEMEKDFGKDIRSRPQFFQSHPYPKNRVKRIRTRIESRGGVPPASIKSTPAFDKALARAREILPYYVALDAALGGEDLEVLRKAADAGIAALPGHPLFHFWRGILYEANEDIQPALVELRKADDIAEHNVLIPYVHCRVELIAGNNKEAEAAATEVIEIVPAIGPAFLMRGMARYRLGRKDAAFRDFDAGLELTPRSDREKLYDAIREQAPDYE